MNKNIDIDQKISILLKFILCTETINSIVEIIVTPSKSLCVEIPIIIARIKAKK